MKEIMLSKGLVVSVILLFLGLAIQPSVAIVETKEEISVEPKDYLFQTIIDIANNPDVKDLLEQYNYDLFKVDIDRSVYRKLLLRNPRLMFNMFFTKPSMSVEYLDKCYNKGIEITNVLGEDKALEMIKSIEIKDTQLLDEIYKMNKEINSDEMFPVLCDYLEILLIGSVGVFFIFFIPYQIFTFWITSSPILSLIFGIIFGILSFFTFIPLSIIFFTMVILDCDMFYDYI